MGIAALAKKKPGRPVTRDVSPDDPALIAVQVTRVYKAWYEKVAKGLRTNNSGAFDRIVAEWYEANKDWAEKNGIGPPPPRT